MLLARGQRQHVANLAVHILRLADDAAGELSRHGGCRGHEAEERAAERRVEAEGLTVADGDVRTHRARRGQNGAGDGVHAHDELGARGVDDLTGRLRVFDLAEVVRLLEVEARGVIAEHFLERVEISSAVLCGDDKKLGIRGEAVGLHDLDDLRMGAGGDIGLRALAVLAHGDRLGCGGRAVVVRGVGNVHAGQLADHRLEFKRALQHTLADLRLIGGVAGDKLFAGGDGFDDRRDEVAVGACAAKNGLEDLVLFGHGGDGLAHLKLAQALGDVQPAAPQEHFLRDGLVQPFQAVDPDGGEHFFPFRSRGGNVRAHVSPPARNALRKRRRQAAPQCRSRGRP